MAQQTAVDWLLDRFLFAGWGLPVEWREQAKAMEKEQMFAYTKDKQVIGEHTEKFFTEDFEQYYNEKYKQ